MPSKAPSSQHTHTHTHILLPCEQLLPNYTYVKRACSHSAETKRVPKNNDTHIKDAHTPIPMDQTCTDFNHAYSHWLCYCFENMIAVTDGMGRREGSGRGEWQGPLHCVWPVWVCVHSYRNWGHTGKACFHLHHRLTDGNKGSNKSPWKQWERECV